MSEQQFHDEVMAELEHKERNKKDIAEQFDDWLYQNYSIGKGHRLVQLMEDNTVVNRFLKDAGLPADTEF